MISKNQIKYIRSLETKKGRSKANVYVAEGPKTVSDLMKYSAPVIIVATEDWYGSNTVPKSSQKIVVTESELRQISFLQHPQQVIAVFNKFEENESKCDIDFSELYLALDGIQDPGNLGTIIRIADWFGIKKIFCSKDTVDVYNPKVVQATMGSIARVEVVYLDLENLLVSLPQGYPVYGTFLDGENIYSKHFSSCGIIIMGNEGNGISDNIKKIVSNRLLIPNFPSNRKTADSLNVAIATAIVCSEFRRRINL